MPLLVHLYSFRASPLVPGIVREYLAGYLDSCPVQVGIQGVIVFEWLY